jgi:hypothetical protein
MGYAADGDAVDWKKLFNETTLSQVFLASIIASETAGIVYYRVQRTSLLRQAQTRATTLQRNLVLLGTDRTPLTHPNYAGNSCVVFLENLEYEDDVYAAYNEALRLAGSPANIFVSTLPTWSLASTFAPGARWAVFHAPPDGSILVTAPIAGPAQRLIAISVLATAIEAVRSK